MLRNNRNLVKCDKDTWNSNNYRYDSSTYDPDRIDSSSASQIYESYLNVCALGSRTSATVGSIGNVSNSANVANVSLDGMNAHCKCLGGLNSSMDALISTMTNVVNATFASEQSAGGLYLSDDGSKEDFASYLKDFALNHSDEIFNMGGTTAFNMSEFGNYADNNPADTSAIPHYSGKITDGNGNITQEYRDYVNGLLLASDGTCLYDGCTITGIDINPENGNVQVSMKAKESPSSTTDFTVHFNPSNPQSLSNAFVSLPGTGGGGSYGSMSYSDFIDDTQYRGDSKYMSATIRGTSSHTVADAAIAAMFGNIIGRGTDAGADNTLNRSVVSAASASENLVCDTAYELMDVSKRIDIMLIDAAANASVPGGSTFVKQLIGDKLVSGQKGGRPDPENSTKLPDGKYMFSDPYAAQREKYAELYNYLKDTGSVIYSYESINGTGSSPNCYIPDLWYQQLADNGLNVVMCLNSDYKEHTNPEYNIFSGELERVMFGFEDSSASLVNLSSGNPNETNPYIALHDNLSQNDRALMTNDNNKYAVYEPGGNGVVNVSVLKYQSSGQELSVLSSGQDISADVSAL